MLDDNFKEKSFKRRRTGSNELIADEKLTNSDGECEIARMDDLKKELELDENNNEDNKNNNSRDLTEGDVYTQLAQRENDLALAKDVGQALLTENIELREKYEALLAIHNAKLESVRQEKHELQLRCDRVESVQEEKIRELTQDLVQLQNKLNESETALKNDQRTRRQNVFELQEENAKLNSELTKVNSGKEELLTEIDRLRRMQRQISYGESPDSEREETDALQEKLLELERERDYLDCSVNELVADKEEFGKEVKRLTQKVITLTEELADSKSELSLCEEDLNSSRKENTRLQEQLEEFKLQTSQHIALSGSSLFSEISMLESEADFNMKLAGSPSFDRKLKSVPSLQGTPKPLAASSSTNLFRPLRKHSTPKESSSSENSLDETSSDYDNHEDRGEKGFVLKQQGYFAELEKEQKANMELRKEMCAVCHQLLQACKLLTNSAYETKQTLEMDIDELFLKDETGAGTLMMIAAEMMGLLKEHLEDSKDETTSKEERECEQERLMTLEKQVEDLTTECFEAKKQLSSLGIQLEQSRKKVEHKEEHNHLLLQKINAQESEIESLNKRNMTYNSVKYGSRSIMEELEKAKTDVKNLDNQLLTAINQKIKLSEQLEQWQHDMASIIEEQVQKQLKNSASERAKKRTSKLPFMMKGWNWTT